MPRAREAMSPDVCQYITQLWFRWRGLIRSQSSVELTAWLNRSGTDALKLRAREFRSSTWVILVHSSINKPSVTAHSGQLASCNGKDNFISGFHTSPNPDSHFDRLTWPWKKLAGYFWYSLGCKLILFAIRDGAESFLHPSIRPVLTYFQEPPSEIFVFVLYLLSSGADLCGC